MINLYEFANNSNYHALLASLQHRMRRGMNITANYTLSKVLDTSDAYSSSVDPFVEPANRATTVRRGSTGGMCSTSTSTGTCRSRAARWESGQWAG